MGLSREGWREFDPVRLVGTNSLSQGEGVEKLLGADWEQGGFTLAGTRAFKGGGERPGLWLRTLDFVLGVLGSQGRFLSRGEAEPAVGERLEGRHWSLGGWRGGWSQGPGERTRPERWLWDRGTEAASIRGQEGRTPP